MGFIESLMKIFNKNEENTIDYVLPSKYMNFPVYPGKMKGKPKERITDNYDRLTIYFKGRPKKDFIKILEDQGFVRTSDVKFDRDHTYVIFESEYLGITKVAYHIKKY